MITTMYGVFVVWTWGLVSGVVIGAAIAILVARIENIRLGSKKDES